MEKILNVRNLSKQYGKFNVLNNISFSLEANQCVGLIGHNGAGKTTLMEILMGIRNQTNGDVIWNNKIKKNFKMKIGIQLQETSLFQKMKVVEAIELFSDLYNVSSERKKEVIRDFELYKVINKYISKLSGGWKNRVSLSLALLHNPSIVFLDEPTTGLDPEASQELWEKISKLKQEQKFILLSTHNMNDIEKYCNKVMILKNGNLVKFDYVENVKYELGNNVSMEDVYMHYCSDKEGRNETL